MGPKQNFSKELLIKQIESDLVAIIIEEGYISKTLQDVPNAFQDLAI